MIFKRKIYDLLLDWKRQSNGRTAVLIEGARRVGKSTVVREFAKKEYRSFIMIDFNTVSEETMKVFKSGLGNNKERFFRDLQLSEGVKLYPHESVVIFDEVQAYPNARQMIKYLVEDGRYDYIETGSLISLKKNIQNITIPSEEKRIAMHPMDFEEFLWALGDDVTIPIIKDAFIKKEALGQNAHNVMMKKYREYMAVGGMPQAVSAFIEYNNYDAIDDVKKQIWSLYLEDVNKIPSPNDIKISLILSTIPFMLGKKNKKFSPGMVKKGAGVADYLSSLEWLEQSKIVNICRNVDEPSPIMAMDADITTIKTYILDTGLLITNTIGDNEKEKDLLYKSMIFDKLSINEGMFFENIVAQELVASDHELYFHLFEVDDRTDTYEIDFLLKDGKNVIPLEVKSSSPKRHASLDEFRKKYKGRCKGAYVIGTKDLRIEDDVTYLPVYMTMFL